MLLVRLVILQDHMIKKLCHRLGTLTVSHHSPNIGGHGHSGSGDIMVLFSQLFLQDDVTKGPSNLMGKSLSNYVTVLAHLGAIGGVVVVDITKLNGQVTL